MSEAAIAVMEITKDAADSGVGICESANCKGCCGDSDKKPLQRFNYVVAILVGLLYIVDIAMDTAAVTDITDVPTLVSIPINESLASALPSSCMSKSRRNQSEEYSYRYKCYNSSVISYSLEDIRTAYYVFLAISWAIFVVEMVTFVLFALIPIFAKKTVVEVSRTLIVGKVMALCVLFLEDLPLTVLKFWYAFSESNYDNLTLTRVSAFVTFFTGSFKAIVAFLFLYTFRAHYEKASGKSLSNWIGCGMLLQFIAEVVIVALSLGTFINFFAMNSACDCNSPGYLL